MFPCRHLLCLATLVAMATACKVVVTYNTDLSGTTPKPLERRSLISDALTVSRPDFVCLQGVWFERDMEFLLTQLKDVYPHHYSKLHAAPGVLRQPTSTVDRFRPKDTPCSLKESMVLRDAVGKCMHLNGCHKLNRIEQGLCVLNNCQHVLNCPEITPECLQCVIGQTEIPTLGLALQDCSTPGESDNRLNAPGLLVLSKTPLTSATYTPFFPDKKLIVERGYIEANLDDGERIICTHLTPLFHTYVEFNLPFSSYEEQQNFEIADLLTKYFNVDHILMGSLNTGPKVVDNNNAEKNLTGVATDNFKTLLEVGQYEFRYMKDDGRCTFCPDNFLNQHPLNPFPKTNVISHVLLNNQSAYMSLWVERVFDNPPMSNHFGVEAVVCEKALWGFQQESFKYG